MAGTESERGRLLIEARSPAEGWEVAWEGSPDFDPGFSSASNRHRF